MPIIFWVIQGPFSLIFCIKSLFLSSCITRPVQPSTPLFLQLNNIFLCTWAWSPESSKHKRVLCVCQVALVIELDDVQDFDSGLAKAIASNTRRYVNVAAEVIYEMLPQYKEREVRWAGTVSGHVSKQLARLAWIVLSVKYWTVMFLHSLCLLGLRVLQMAYGSYLVKYIGSLYYLTAIGCHFCHLFYQHSGLVLTTHTHVQSRGMKWQR